MKYKMTWNSFYIIVFLLWAAKSIAKVENDFEKLPVGILDGIINKTMEMLRPNLANLQVKKESFKTGPQEFGDFSGNVSEVIVEGLENFNVKIFDSTLLDVNNLTIVEEKFTARGLYYINGTMAFPLGKNDIHLYGEGKFSATFTNFTFSVKMKIRSEKGKKVLKEFDIVIGLDKFQVYLENLMDGGDLEKIFNQLINDVGLTVFNYYKEPVLSIVKPEIVKKITEMLNKDDQLTKVEL